MDMLHQFFYEMDIEAIKNIPLSSMNQSDFWAWHYEKNGSFSVRSAYRMLIQTKMNRENWLEDKAVFEHKEGG